MSSTATVIEAIAMTTSNRKMALSAFPRRWGLARGWVCRSWRGAGTDGSGDCEGEYYANRVKLRPSLLLRRPEGLTVPASGSWGLASLGPVNPAFAGLFYHNPDKKKGRPFRGGPRECKSNRLAMEVFPSDQPGRL